MDVPTTSQRMAAPMAIEIVTGRSLTISCHTGTLLTKEKPRQGGGQWSLLAPASKSRPTKTPSTKCQYCTGIGSSRPNLISISLMVSAVGALPANSAAVLVCVAFGIRKKIPNVTMLTIHSSPTTRIRRRARGGRGGGCKEGGAVGWGGGRSGPGAPPPPPTTLFSGVERTI